MSKSVRALLICPRYDPHSFWSFEGAVEVLGAKYPTSPLGLITLAALLPADWDLKLVDCNTEDLTDDHLAWSDLAMIGGMMAQQKDTLRLIGECRKHNVPRSEEHTSELQSRPHLVCRLLLEKKKKRAVFLCAAQKKRNKNNSRN